MGHPVLESPHEADLTEVAVAYQAFHFLHHFLGKDLWECKSERDSREWFKACSHCKLDSSWFETGLAECAFNPH